MAYTGEIEERTRLVTSAVTMNSDRAATKPLHNFSLPWDLKWGNQRHLRCMKVEDSDAGEGFDRRSAPGRSRRREPEASFERRSRPRMEEGIEAVREKLMFEFKTAADKMKHAIFRSQQPATADDVIEAIPPAVAASAVVDDVAAEMPWNLRTRRAACKAPIDGGGGKGLKKEERSEGNNNNGGGKSSGSDQDRPKERPTFAIALSRKEVDEDFKAMLGHRAPRRPKKRPRAVQKQLDALFPGMWLTEVSADSYKVPEVQETVKR